MKLSRRVYDRETLLKTAFAFTDDVYIHLDANEEEYIVTMHPKKGNLLEEDITLRFENELIAQQTRRIVANSTKSIREMIVARALASTVVDLSEMNEQEDSDFSAEEILQDWFEKNE